MACNFFENIGFLAQHISLLSILSSFVKNCLFFIFFQTSISRQLKVLYRLLARSFFLLIIWTFNPGHLLLIALLIVFISGRESRSSFNTKRKSCGPFLFFHGFSSYHFLLANKIPLPRYIAEKNKKNKPENCDSNGDM